VALPRFQTSNARLYFVTTAGLLGGAGLEPGEHALAFERFRRRRADDETFEHVAVGGGALAQARLHPRQDGGVLGDARARVGVLVNREVGNVGEALLALAVESGDLRRDREELLDAGEIVARRVDELLIARRGRERRLAENFSRISRVVGDHAVVRDDAGAAKLAEKKIPALAAVGRPDQRVGELAQELLFIGERIGRGQHAGGGGCPRADPVDAINADDGLTRTAEVAVAAAEQEGEEGKRRFAAQGVGAAPSCFIDPNRHGAPTRPARLTSRPRGAAAAATSGRFSGAGRAGRLVQVPLDADHRQNDDAGRLADTHAPPIAHPLFQRESDDSSHVPLLRAVGRAHAPARLPETQDSICGGHG